MHTTPVIAITVGDVCGVGPEIVLRALSDPEVRNACRPVVLCSVEVLNHALEVFDLPAQRFVSVTEADVGENLWNATAKSLPATPVLDPRPIPSMLPTSGKVEVDAGAAAFEFLLSAIRMAKRGTVDAIATAPLNKAALHAAGHRFPGHTEILAAECGVNEFAMMLHLPEARIRPLRQLIPEYSDSETSSRFGLSIAHTTLHTSIASVPSLLSSEGIVETAELMDGFLTDLGCERKSIGIAALNPHAGETGLFGTEEIDVISPAVELLSGQGLNVMGPLPIDTLIRRSVAGEFDGVVAMYHDQGHIPIKMIGFDAAVNITLGLPIVRTSPTHGTAFDRAWNSDSAADPSGMIEAILTAASLCNAKRE